MDLKKEFEQLNDNEYFKAKEGKTELVIIGEPIDESFIGDDEKLIPQAEFDIQIKGKNYKWTVTKGKTLKSLWGQLLLVSKANDYKFNGQKITLLTMGEGKKARYTVLEAADLMSMTTEEKINC